MGNETQRNLDSEADRTDIIGQIIGTAGHREAPPDDDYRQVLAAAETAWRRKTDSRRRQRWMSTGLVAAAAAIATVAILSLQTPQPTPEYPAVIQKVIGTVSVQAQAGDDWTLVTGNDQQIGHGSLIRTNGDSFAGLVLDNGLSLRVGQNTTVTIDAVSRISLAIGTVYVDTGFAGEHESFIEIATPIGVARDLGTQFEVHYLADNLRVRVREGIVLVEQEGMDFESGASEQLDLNHTGRVVMSRIKPDDEAWHWTQLVAPHPQINEQPLTVLLEWVARETGKRVEFDKPQVKTKVSRTILHGSVQNLPPMRALDVMLATTDLDYVLLDDRVILIRIREEHLNAESDT